MLVEESTGQVRFRDFVQDEVAMRKVFQDFVYNFYRLEQSEFKVSSERLAWDAAALSEEARAVLPEMVTDVSLTKAKKKIVIETKFTPRLLQRNWEKDTIRSGHLYQLFAYLKNLEGLGDAGKQCEGVLLYPTVGRSLDVGYVIQGHPVRVRTINLDQSWIGFRADLLQVVGLSPKPLNVPNMDAP